MSKASVAGNLTYWSETEAAIDSAATVTGKVEKKAPPTGGIEEEKIAGIITAGALFAKLISLISLFILGLLLIRFLPKYTDNVVKTLRTRPWASLGIGFLAIVLTPILAIILMVTLVGIPFSLALLATLFFFLFFGRIFAVYLLGQIVMERSGRKIHQVWALVIGLVIYIIISMIPVIGSLVSWFAMFFGVGAYLITKRDTYFAARSKNII